ncbi:glycoside hydrolase family 2 protein [Microbacterium sp. bgisy189]|uniref:glycoside hydrolase family 2 protein n=1 Tax=Microbacterium sp. bgisy189 TaxID=3413798 RepID=UPI003EBD5334
MSAPAIAPLAVRSRDLHTGWSVRAAGGPTQIEQTVPATVPGVVHLDLLAAGLIPDPYLDDNESALAWIGLVDWTYETSFEITEADRAERMQLVFDGIDTVATVLLDGSPIAEVANQHRSYRIDAADALTVGAHTLTVAFRSPVRHANAQSLELGTRPRPYPLPYDAIRKSACSFGWDWGIATFTSGLWRGVRLESWNTARLADVRVVAMPTGDGGRVTASVTVERITDAELTLVLDVAGTSAEVTLPAGATTAEATVELEAVDRWWPAGHGAQPLYDVAVRLDAASATVDEATRRVGFRTVRWNTEPDAAGTPFQLEVNDRPVFVKGVNWIPDDAFPTRVDAARYRHRLQQAKDANLNLIRVWGGGIYESEDFYDACDELGLLTWQDFLFACAAYSEDEPLRGEIEAEARENIARLGHRASLVLLTGNNENLWGYEDWGWKKVLDGKSWGAYYYYELFPALVGEIAPHVPYAPGSPFSPGEGRHPNEVDHGTMHLWEQWNRLDWPTYRDQKPRFVAEFGWQGPPTWTTLTGSISDDPLTPESPGMVVHQKAIDGNSKLTSGLVGHYRVPEVMEDWHWAMQLNQANAVTCALDWFRGHAPHTSGAVVWQINDCWPVTSWAAIDGEGREKPLLHAIRNAFAPRTVTVLPSGDDGSADALFAAVGNDTDEAWSGELVARRVAYDGTELERTTVDLTVAARETVRVPLTLAQPDQAGSELVVVDAIDVRGFWFHGEPRDSALADPALSAEVVAVGDGFDVQVTAGAVVRDLTLLVDKIAPTAVVDGGLITLLPGEQHVFRVTGLSSLTAEQVLASGVARSGNDLVVTA